MPLIWLVSGALVLIAVLGVALVERGARGGSAAERAGLRPAPAERLGRTGSLSREAKTAGWRAFRGWGWAGAILLAEGAVMLGFTNLAHGFTPNLGLTLAVIASGVLAWTLGAGIGVTRAFDPPEHAPRPRAEPRREPGRGEAGRPGR